MDELLVDIADVIERTDGLRIAELVSQPYSKFTIWYRDKPVDLFLAGWERAVAVRRVHTRANNILGFERIRVRRHAPCPQCGLPTLGTWIGDPTVECSDDDCGLVMSLEDYDQYCMELSEGRK